MPIEEAFDYVALLWKGKSVLFSEFTCFAHSVNLFRPKGWKSDDDSLWLHHSRPLEVDMADYLVPQLDVRLGFEILAYIADFSSFELRINIWPSLRPLAMSQPSFCIKHPSLLKHNYMPCLNTSWPTETKFFDIIRTCKTFLMQLFFPSLPNGMLSMCRMGCVVSSTVSM